MLEPALQGPYKASGQGAMMASDRVCQSVLQVGSMPFSLVRVSLQAVDVLVSFESPELRFKKDIVENGVSAGWSLVSIGQCSITVGEDGTNKDKEDAKVEVRVGQTAAGEDSIMSLNVRSDSVGSKLFELDLSGLNALKEDLISGQ